MKIRDDVNEYGTPVTWFRCETCGREYSVCPAVSPDREDGWRNCLADECGSYDPSRDVSIYFAPDDPDLIEGDEPTDPGAGFLFREPL